MKIAYLITAYHNPKHLQRLIHSLDDRNSTFYVHIDKKSKMKVDVKQEISITYIDPINVWWGGWSHQRAILNLMKSSVSNKYDYYILISGVDYPLRPLPFLYNLLEKGGEYINIVKGFQTHKPETRVKYYYYDGFDRRNRNSFKTKIHLKAERFQNRFFSKANYPFEDIYHGSTWWALTHDCISYILAFLDNNTSYIRFYKSSWCAEESFIHTIIGNSDFFENCKKNLTYTDWSTNPAPALINYNHLNLFKTQYQFESVYGLYTPFFARKFNDESKDIIEIINNELRN